MKRLKDEAALENTISIAHVMSATDVTQYYQSMMTHTLRFIGVLVNFWTAFWYCFHSSTLSGFE